MSASTNSKHPNVGRLISKILKIGETMTGVITSVGKSHSGREIYVVAWEDGSRGGVDVEFATCRQGLYKWTEPNHQARAADARAALDAIRRGDPVPSASNDYQSRAAAMLKAREGQTPSALPAPAASAKPAPEPAKSMQQSVAEHTAAILKKGSRRG